MKLKAAFIFVAPEADRKTHRSSIDTPAVELISVGVKDYADAEVLAKELVLEGVAAIELCGGFGSDGVARVSQAVEGRAAVGVVRFDNHPGLDYQSGDAIFQ
ncbi:MULTISPECIES: DUF6506 family protein [Corallincola]|uniref:Transcriptional regulator n=2 Tax=Corallincola TaxID=1775176 RepID=A0ABY1WMA0_9GAMM|nr:MULTISPECIES: DUF6506 family protein [Corallincola]TAA42706.1 hypothetical protein EXY25_15585 [Corallincola spongiicola]TCI01643.1 hypothetical protein EZV61_16865 [Corallincola luteus]